MIMDMNVSTIIVTEFNEYLKSCHDNPSIGFSTVILQVIICAVVVIIIIIIIVVIGESYCYFLFYCNTRSIN